MSLFIRNLYKSIKQQFKFPFSTMQDKGNSSPNQATISASEETKSQTSHNFTEFSNTTMPSYFIAHGAPTIVIEDGKYPQYLAKLGASIPKPKAIVLFSAHWEEKVQTISCIDGQYSMIYDFYGFPKIMYQMVYSAKGDPTLAEEIQKLLGENKIKANLDKSRGIDHGTWTILKIMFPKADIPLIQMSVNPNAPIEDLYNIGKALGPLREKGILILGSGVTTHNLRNINWDYQEGDPVEKWASDFEEWIETETKAWNKENIFDYRKKAPNAKMAVPTAEHFVPYVIAMGAGDENKKPILEYKEFQLGTLSLTVWRYD